ncbi:hypothetical protein TIFTF001_025351 [Ficus carica]|uniref:Uncharacterized protein n=1 Tax=Ficus carica TaxID=3494 RepID=A0AA88AWN3_FICCA|nr:hypothetical protein TIFTF001_025351 [Ficus carica]
MSKTDSGDAEVVDDGVGAVGVGQFERQSAFPALKLLMTLLDVMPA